MIEYDYAVGLALRLGIGFVLGLWICTILFRGIVSIIRKYKDGGD